jgi:hypothetical protein
MMNGTVSRLIVLYRDAGHGFLCQHIDDFAHEVDGFVG